MKRFACAIAILAVFAADAAAIQINMSNGYAQITGPTTMRINNVSVVGNNYWADLEWNSTDNVFEVTNFGLMGCTSMVGLWELWYDWGCTGVPSWTTIQFFGDGTFLTGDANDGTWTQDGCDVDWVYWNGTHYWGVMDDNGLHMEGDMWAAFPGDGCWSTDRSYSRKSESKEKKAKIGSSGELTGENP